MFRSAESVSLLITAVSATMLAMAVLTTYPAKLEPASARVTELDVSTGLSLDRVADPKHTLPTLLVETSRGERIGEVRSVKMGRGGVEAVTVKTNGLFGIGAVTTTMQADDLVYMRGRNTLVSRLTGAELATKDRPKKARL